jgi:hypothetical protein
MIPPPVGFRQRALYWVKAKQSHHLSQSPKTALRNAQGPSGQRKVVGRPSANQQVVG